MAALTGFRARFDRGEIDASGTERPRQQYEVLIPYEVLRTLGS
jgi:hypothetical protein